VTAAWQQLQAVSSQAPNTDPTRKTPKLLPRHWSCPWAHRCIVRVAGEEGQQCAAPSPL